ncbi:MAG: SAM-dependent methyltransferase [Gorillibacterium sp.]|nr:SAM-dependent methyltransferase [Gorillibacterium sp.]
MEQVKRLIEDLVNKEKLVQATLSGPRTKTPETAVKIKLKPILLKGIRHYQLSYSVGTKELHENLPPAAAIERMADRLLHVYKQGLFQSTDGDYQVLVNKKGKASILRREATRQQAELTHNRAKKYLLPEGEPVAFLVELGVMNAAGKVVAAKYDKFRQINRFLEMIEDVIPELPQGRTLRIIDFGCGKSYLTFALYHYLVNTKGRDVEVTGLDLKADVITHCASLAARLQYAGLHFQIGDIADYDEVTEVDMVVTLHACDTATDAALNKAIRWNASVILSVPCCQHEMYGQVQNETLSTMLDHGIIKERFAALATDSVRARLLELVGYKSQILEFIDMEHTPKNLLIRAVRQTSSDPAQLNRLALNYLEFKQFLGITPYLELALEDRLRPLFEAAPIDTLSSSS